MKGRERRQEGKGRGDRQGGKAGKERERGRSGKSNTYYSSAPRLKNAKFASRHAFLFSLF